ncbi:MAG TPA: LuxR C-terminal-related transcriptional regulator, partial [Prolixibacteraceae bacterium]|nr:LuxR C-terminal-related transcriptional regulator [Prolixibacteraceae bacterium]
DIPAGFSDKLTLLVPAIGIPFMVISWFMLIKFIYRLNGYILHRITVISYFVVFFTMLFTVAFLVQNQLIKLPFNPLVFVVRLLVILNFIVHLVLIYPVINPKKNSTASFSTKPFQKIIAFYFTGVVVYSLLLWFFEIFGFISTCISILVLFAVSVSVPVFIKLYPTRLFQTEKPDNIDFNAFCTLYEISNREAEIILEICSGKSNKAIAEKLFITLQTVKDHNHRIYTKTQVKSRVQLTNLVHEKTGKTPLPNKV